MSRTKVIEGKFYISTEDTKHRKKGNIIYINYVAGGTKGMLVGYTYEGKKFAEGSYDNINFSVEAATAKQITMWKKGVYNIYDQQLIHNNQSLKDQNNGTINS
jgi:hypothetical protein